MTGVPVKRLVTAMDDVACEEVDDSFGIAISEAIDVDAPVDHAS